MSESGDVGTNGAAIDKRPETIGGLFDAITPTYDNLNRMMSMSADIMWRKQGLDRLDIQKGDEVLDIATGTGDMAIQAAGRTECSIVGIDLSKNMMLEAERKWGRQKVKGRYSLVKGDALAMPFPDGTFDKAMVAYGIRNMVDIDRFVGEVHRVLRPGGRFLVLELSVPACRITRPIYLLYLTRIMPLIGRFQSGNQAAYEYLRDSILTFPAPDEVERLMERKGFRIVSSVPQTMNICHLYVMEKGRDSRVP
ncbi:bifunctional demethylmenaquinone methyltransferase/2-methoxy-6-polyprenyl-1,4-benzoquinol methylase UbiE [Methanomassiliicoccus luminyensis]|jgi:demethylmenaquinone methyltransferase/2-methoxy-6-polyprenyl-1,4-benzoquinol methylase|uniref:bifunctional demethylmenaquinone methyltransferase/2-methoxy-6-polyprenyl-1,4-benzoquinol methylase UbiE n=1 Tax=Methanomassiliicoccus luminyensis TaxID=1080712 RepID=UPI000361550D|nr:bifunctional demethylmenaquinone methyltransferase/2-methoxy-6-polyprenyl-1,4-benzoquinol methylase UbiE [Methanomassiliicoccus luminyensis]